MKDAGVGGVGSGGRANKIHCHFFWVQTNEPGGMDLAANTCPDWIISYPDQIKPNCHQTVPLNRERRERKTIV